MQLGVDINLSLGSSVLVKCANAKNWGLLVFLLENGAILTSIDNDIRSQNVHKNILSLAINDSQWDIVKTLLKYKANVSTDMLIQLINIKQTELVQVILSNPNYTFSDAQLEKLLPKAVEEGQVELVSAIIERAHFAIDKKLDGRTLLHYACKVNPNVEMVRWLLAHGSPVDSLSAENTTPIYVALMNLGSTSEINEDICNLLLERGANLNTVIDNQSLVMRMTSTDYYLRELNWLIRNKADLNYKNAEGESAILMAAQKQSLECLGALIASGAHVHDKDNVNNSILHILAGEGVGRRHGPDFQNYKNRIIQTIVEKGLDANVKNGEGETAILVAARNRFYDTVIQLLISNADPNIKSKDGVSIFTLLFGDGKFMSIDALPVIQTLLNKGYSPNDAEKLSILTVMFDFADLAEIQKTMTAWNISPNQINAEGNTPLHIATRMKRKEVVEWLVKQGADVNSQNTNGYSPIMVTFDLAILDILFENGADINFIGKNGDTALTVEASRQREEKLKWLLSHGAAVDQKDGEGFSALHHAFKSRNSIQNAIHLLSCNASINSSNAMGETILMTALDSPEWFELAMKSNPDLSKQNN